MAVELIAKVQQKNNGDFKLLDASDLDAGDVDVILALVAGGRIVAGSDASAPAGEIVVQSKTTTGPPTHAATQATLCWNAVDKILYANSDGATTWEDVSGGAAGGLPAHLSDTEDAHDASAISVVPFGSTAATDVQAALEEIAAEAGAGGHPDLAAHDALGLATDAELADHTGDASDAHAAGAVSVVPFDPVAGTDAQTALEELGGQILSRVLAGANDGLGGTDDGPALQALHDSLPAAGGTIYLDGDMGPALGHLIDSQVVISKPNVSILGERGAEIVFGPNAPDKAIHWTGANGKLFALRLDTSALVATEAPASVNTQPQLWATALEITGDNFELRWVRDYADNTDCTWAGTIRANGCDRPRFRDSLFDSVPPWFEACTNGLMDNVYITNALTGIYANDCIGLTINSPWIISSAPRQEYALATASWAAGVATFTFAAPQDFLVNHKVTVRGVNGATDYTGFNSISGSKISTVSVDKMTITLPLAADPGAATPATGMMSSASTGMDGLLVEDTTNYGSHDITIEDPHILSAREHGMYISGVHRNLTVSGGEITGCGRQAIKILGGYHHSQDITISGTSIGPGFDDDLGYSCGGVYLGHADNVAISGLDITFAAGIHGNIGIYLAGELKNISVSDNVIHDIYYGFGVYLSDDFSDITLENADLKDITISGNTFVNAYQYGLGSVRSGGAPITVSLAHTATILDGLKISDNYIVDNQSVVSAPYAIYLADTTATTRHVYIGANRGYGQATGYTYKGTGWEPEDLLRDEVNTWTRDNHFSGATASELGLGALSLQGVLTPAQFVANVDDFQFSGIVPTARKSINSDTDASSYTVSGGYGAVGDTVLIWIISTKASDPEVPTLTDPSLTRIKLVASTVSGSVSSRAHLFKADVAAVTSSTMTVDFGATQTGCQLQVVEMTNTKPSAQMVVQAVVDTPADTSTTPTVVTDSPADISNVMFGFFDATLALTAGAGWTDLSNLTRTTPAQVSLVEYKLNGDDPNATRGVSTATTRIIGVEIAAASPYSVLRVSSDAARNWTGIAGGKEGRLLLLENIGAFAITLKHDATSTSANRFYCPGSADFVLGAGSSTLVVYDATVSRWRVLGRTAAAGGTPAVVLGTVAAAGVASTFLRDDDTIVAFDATVPSTQAFGDAAATGAAAVAARRDHKHAMPSERAASSTTPEAVGTAAVGTGTTDARSDHVHAASGDTPSTQAFSDAAAAGSSAKAAQSDHKHAWPALGTSAAAVGTSAGGSATTPSKSDHVHATGAGTPSTQAFGDAAAVGSGPAAAMTDHKHAWPALGTTAAAVGTSAGGSATTPSKSDHVHATGAGTPSTQASGDAAATGTGPAAAMTDHKHAMPILWVPVVFSKSGVLAIGAGTFRIYNDTDRTLTIVTVRASVGTAPATQSILCDVNIDGTSIWASTQANRVAVAAAANTGTQTAFDTTTIAVGHYFTVDIDQVGTGTLGSDLTVAIWLKG